jgi:hypothetical protein
MTVLLKIVSALALAGTIVPPLLYFRGGMELEAMKLWLAAATVAWFAATPFWMKGE